ncbi:MAG TPA: SDR family NAD(P)-dependent oxidoreductase [Saprospiraceae bacterium]|nr:SDR family NAD(P)-dependent oxidoreductase [Saprospiraceae bacterium]
MEPVSIALAYCIDNLPLAEGMEQALSPTRYNFQHFYCKKSERTPPETLAEQLQHQDGPILLLISDNFLKSLNCMNQSLKLIQSRSSDIIPVVVNGRKLDEKTGEYVDITTRFEKIGDIIPYINFWQNQYLDLRSQRSTIETETNYDKEGFSEHLRVLRQVSSEASEFLRVLRNLQHYTFEEFSADHFQAFFQFLDDEEEWEAFRAKAPQLDLPLNQQAPANPDTEVSEEIVDEEEVKAEADELDESLPDTSAIPGMELLEGRDNINKIIQNKRSHPPVDPVELPDEQDEEIREENYPDANPQDLFEQLEEDDPDDESDVFDDLLVDEQLGGPAGSEDKVEEEQVEDNDPTPENSEEEEEEEPFEDENNEEPVPPLDLSEQFDDQLAEANQMPYNGEPGDESAQAEDIIEQAFALANADQLEDAIQMMQQATRQYGDHTSLRYHFALLLAQNTSELNKAIHQLDVLLEMDPNHLEGNFLMGELAEIQEQYATAQKHYKEVLKVDPSYQNVYARMGIVSLNQDPADKKAAKKYFKKALKQNPEHVDAHYQYALLINELKNKPKKAIKYLKKALKLQPQHPFANYDLALLHHQLENPIDAHFYYQKAIAINPELQTDENDEAFSKPPKKAKKVKKAFPKNKKASMDNSNTSEEKRTMEGSDTLTALKENISKLEALLAEKAQTAKTPAPPKVDKTVLITGATAGIGRATAITFAENGYRLILNGRRRERLEELRSELEEKYQSDLLLLPFDVRDVQAIQAAVDNLPAQWEKIDILINNAGKAKGFAPIHEGELRHWEEMIDVNIKGLLYLTRAVAPAMVARKGGHIINLGSTAGKEVYPNGNVYCATKFAVEALTRAIRLDLYKHNIKVSQVSPGHVEETEFALVRFDGDKERAKIYDDFNPLTSRDVAETIFFIASRPPHVNVQDILMMGTQQAGSNFIDRSGRMEEEE